MIKRLLRKWLEIPEPGVAPVTEAAPAPAIGHNGGPPLEEPTKFVESAGRTVEDEDFGWTPLTGASRRDLSPLTYDRMRELALYLWRGNLLANRLIELPLAYLLGEGVKLTAKDPKDQEELTAFWKDPINAMDRKLPKRVREWLLLGEACWPAFVNDVDGAVRIGYLDPAVIATVVMDPDNAEQPIGVVTKRDDRGRTQRYRIIVNGPESVFTAKTQKIRESFDTGECFFFRLNDLCLGQRGSSLLLAAMDWVDAYDEALFGEQERQQALRAFFWDVTLKGATPTEVEARAKKITSPRTGSTRVHNDAEEWQAVTPELGAGDSSIAARLFRNHILGGLTLPEHWFGGGGDVNRNTASEMGEPTFKVFSMLQRELKGMLEEVGSYVLRTRRGKLTRTETSARTDAEVTAVFSELTARDTTKWAAALQQVIAGCVTAIEGGVMTDETAVALIAVVASRLGVEIDVEDELAKAKVAAAARREADTIVPPRDEEEPVAPPVKQAAD